MIKKTLIFALISVLMFLAIAPVLAENTKKISVTFTRTGGFVTTGEHWYSDQTDYHLRDTIVGFHTYAVVGLGVSYSGDGGGTLWTNLHDVHKFGSYTIGYGQSTTDSQIVFDDGTFEGIIQMKGTFAISPETAAINLRGYTTLVNGEFRGIWHGTGDYRGQTLMLEYDVVNGVIPSPLIGTLLIP